MCYTGECEFELKGLGEHAGECNEVDLPCFPDLPTEPSDAEPDPENPLFKFMVGLVRIQADMLRGH